MTPQPEDGFGKGRVNLCRSAMSRRHAMDAPNASCQLSLPASGRLFAAGPNQITLRTMTSAFVIVALAACTRQRRRRPGYSLLHHPAEASVPDRSFAGRPGQRGRGAAARAGRQGLPVGRAQRGARSRAGRDPGFIEAGRAPIMRELQTACPKNAARESRPGNIINRVGEAAGCLQLGRPATMAASDTGAQSRQQVCRA